MQGLLVFFGCLTPALVIIIVILNIDPLFPGAKPFPDMGFAAK